MQDHRNLTCAACREAIRPHSVRMPRASAAGPRMVGWSSLRSSRHGATRWAGRRLTSRGRPASMSGRSAATRRATRSPPLTAAKALADALNVSIDTLAGGIPSDGITGLWWMAWRAAAAPEALFVRIEIAHSGTGYLMAVAEDPDSSPYFPAAWRATLTRSRNGSYMGYSLSLTLASILLLESRGSGWFGQWIRDECPSAPRTWHHRWRTNHRRVIAKPRPATSRAHCPQIRLPYCPETRRAGRVRG